MVEYPVKVSRTAEEVTLGWVMAELKGRVEGAQADARRWASMLEREPANPDLVRWLAHYEGRLSGLHEALQLCDGVTGLLR